MQTKYTYKQIWLIAYPILISLLMEQMIGMTDTAFLGRVGEVELGASAIAGVFYMVIFMVAFGFSIGAQILIARRNGERQYKEIGDLFYQGIYFQVGMAAVMFLLSYCFSPIILKRIVASEHIYEAATSYLHWRVFGAFFSFSAVMFRAFFLGTTQTKTLTLNSIVMVLSNVVFNYIFVFGHFGAPEMGIAGAALGSVLAEATAALHFFLYTFFYIDRGKYQLFRFRSGGFGLIREILNVSVWSMILYFLTIGTWFLFFVAVEHLGELPLAISNIIRSTSTLLFMPVNAFGATACTLVSNAMGARRADDVIPIVRRIVKMCYAIVLPLIALLCLAPHWILLIYTNDSSLIAECTHSVYVMSSFYLIALPGNILFQSVSGTGDTRTAFLIEMTTIVFYTLAIYWIIVTLQVDIAFCWTVEYVYWGFKLFLSFLFFKKTNWKVKKI